MEFHKESEASDSNSTTQEGGSGSPHEALFLVLCYLPAYELLAMTQVCRSLREALNNDILPWLNILVGKPLNKRLSNDNLLNLTSKAKGRLKTLALFNCLRITDDGLLQVIAMNPLINPSCISLTPTAVIEAVKLFGKNNHRLKSLRIRGIYSINKEDLGMLHHLIDDENQPRQKEELNFYQSRKDFLTFQHSGPAIDVDICPMCDEVRTVFDCPRHSGTTTRRRQQQKMECRGCMFCIPWCEECGTCIQEEDPTEATCEDILCLDCWFKLPKCSFCNKPYCTLHADQKHSLSGSSEFVCENCHARFIENS